MSKKIDFKSLGLSALHYLDRAVTKRSNKGKGDQMSNKTRGKESSNVKHGSNNNEFLANVGRKADRGGQLLSVLGADGILEFGVNIIAYYSIRRKAMNATTAAKRKLFNRQADKAQKKVMKDATRMSRVLSAVYGAPGYLWGFVLVRTARAFTRRAKKIKSADVVHSSSNKSFLEAFELIDRFERLFPKRTSGAQLPNAKNTIYFKEEPSIIRFLREIGTTIPPSRFRPGTTGPEGFNHARENVQLMTFAKLVHMRWMLKYEADLIVTDDLTKSEIASIQIRIDKLFFDDEVFGNLFNDAAIDEAEEAELKAVLGKDQDFDPEHFIEAISTLLADDLVKSKIIKKRDTYLVKSAALHAGHVILRNSMKIPVRSIDVPTFYDTRKISKKKSAKNLLKVRFGIDPSEYNQVEELLNAASK